MFCPWSRPWDLNMDSLQVSVLVLGLVFVLSVQTGYSEDLFCHSCNSAEFYDGDGPTGCSDPFDITLFKKNCTQLGIERGVTYKYCRKMGQMVEGEYRIIRQCATDGRVGQCVDRTGTKLVKVKYCECDGHLCNTASPMFNINMLLLAMSSALLALICHS